KAFLMPALIAIVGRPNVGKSALFNRIAGKRIAIVHDQPGVTRDRISAEVEWHAKPFTLVDTGGSGLLGREKCAGVIAQAALAQVNLAIEAANLVFLVVNVEEGVVPLDREVAQRLRRSGKPVMVVVNKVDTHRREAAASEFAELGFERIFPVSAIHGEGIEELMDATMALPELAAGTPPSLSSEAEAGQELDEHEISAEPALMGGTDGPPALKLAIVGRPNVGKSSILNALTQSERVVVSPVPGTTRDSVDAPFEVETEGVRERYILIDTAGIRKTRRIDDSIEFFSVKRAEDSIARCDIA